MTRFIRGTSLSCPRSNIGSVRRRSLAQDASASLPTHTPADGAAGMAAFIPDHTPGFPVDRKLLSDWTRFSPSISDTKTARLDCATSVVTRAAWVTYRCGLRDHPLSGPSRKNEWIWSALLSPIDMRAARCLKYARDFIMETDHEKTHHASNYSWCRVTNGSSLLNPMVAKERGLRSADCAANAVRG
jgi:hypothetical protein